MPHSSSMFNDTCRKKRTSQKICNLFHISFFQFFTDISTADLTVAIHFFCDHNCFIVVFFSIFFQKLRRSLALMTKTEIFSHNHTGSLKIPFEYLSDKNICFHMLYLIIQRTFQQYVHAHFFQKYTTFF